MIWPKLRFLLLTATPTAILYVLWIFSRKRKKSSIEDKLFFNEDKVVSNLNENKLLSNVDNVISNEDKLLSNCHENHDLPKIEISEVNLNELRGVNVRLNSGVKLSKVSVDESGCKLSSEKEEEEEPLRKSSDEDTVTDSEGNVPVLPETVCRFVHKKCETATMSGENHSIVLDSLSYDEGYEDMPEIVQKDSSTIAESKVSLASENILRNAEETSSRSLFADGNSPDDLEKSSLHSSVDALFKRHAMNSINIKCNADVVDTNGTMRTLSFGQIENDSNATATSVKDNQHVETSSELRRDSKTVSYRFNFPSELCGRLIGRQGQNIAFMRERSGAEVVVKMKTNSAEYRVIVLEGTQRQVTKALELIKNKFPENRFPNVSYAKCLSEETPIVTPGMMQLSLPWNVAIEVVVSNIVAPNHIFLQQPTHPTFPHLERLMLNMKTCYSVDVEIPDLTRPLEVGVICVALMDNLWYRVQIVEANPETDECDVKLVDYGGYYRVQGATLKQIRRDFMTIPFQAIECYLYNIISPKDNEDFPVEARLVLEQLVNGKILQVEVLSVGDDGVPYVEMTRVHGVQTLIINRELVVRGVARSLED